MIIDRINISNFRSYFGDVQIDFKTDSNKNITLISGKNGFGKTSFLTALIWGFYGKLMSKVEDKYRSEIKSLGGYENYLLQQFNRAQKTKSELSVEIILSDVVIPSIPCKRVSIKRSFNVKTKKETLDILIDGDQNELSVQVGYETFINDFILPREIAKFFFFDSEKIVSLAEAKTKDELRSLGRAYSEVLGLKKYDDLKIGLQTLISSIKRRGVSHVDSDSLSELLEEKKHLQMELEFNNETNADLTSSLENFKIKSDNVQEKLIREGSTISIGEFKIIKGQYQELLNESKNIRKKLNANLEFFPFLVAGSIFKKLIQQVKLELKQNQSSLNLEMKERILGVFKKTILALDSESQTIFLEQFSNELSGIDRKFAQNILLDYSDEVLRKILSIDENINNSYIKTYRSLIKEEKDNRFMQNKTQRLIKSFEVKKANPLSEKYRDQKREIDENIENILKKLGALEQSKNELINRLSNLNKRISEIENRQEIVGQDQRKLQLSIDVLERINRITERIKTEKKYALEKSILLGLNSLMHKKSFVERVEIEIFEDYLDIHLFDLNGEAIDKESLSKGEQQLYATSILKSLVEESGISFPIFVDSPLQKFDKEHSCNIIKKFYPRISKQVVLFPLIEKELTMDEFKLMESNIASLHKIINTDGKSKIERIHNSKEFFQ